MSEDIVGQIRDVKGRTWQEAFYIQTKAFLEKNSEHIKEVERLKAKVVRLTKAGDKMAHMHRFFGFPSYTLEWEAAKEGKQP